MDVAGAVDSDPAALEAARKAGLNVWPTLADALEAGGWQAAVGVADDGGSERERLESHEREALPSDPAGIGAARDHDEVAAGDQRSSAANGPSSRQTTVEIHAGSRRSRSRVR